LVRSSLVKTILSRQNLTALMLVACLLQLSIAKATDDLKQIGNYIKDKDFEAAKLLITSLKTNPNSNIGEIDQIHLAYYEDLISCNQTSHINYEEC